MNILLFGLSISNDLIYLQTKYNYIWTFFFQTDSRHLAKIWRSSNFRWHFSKILHYLLDFNFFLFNLNFVWLFVILFNDRSFFLNIHIAWCILSNFLFKRFFINFLLFLFNRLFHLWNFFLALFLVYDDGNIFYRLSFFNRKIFFIFIMWWFLPWFLIPISFLSKICFKSFFLL